MQERGVSRQPLLEVLGAALVLIGLWSFAAYSFGILALPAPLAVFRHLFGEALIGIMPHLGISLYRILVGLSLSLLFAVPLGMILGQVPAIDRLLAPMIYLVYPIPKIVLLPLFLILVGIGDLSKILLICVIVFFQLLVSTRDAAKAIDPR
ncbi:MAG: ABC transporter permease, partial [Chlamydiia bacterium]|nr:ABC transporter permease [Chlamydiia bacterium]